MILLSLPWPTRLALVTLFITPYITTAAGKDCPACMNRGSCDVMTKECVCPIPFSGDTCDVKYCADAPSIYGTVYQKSLTLAKTIELSCDKNHYLVLGNDKIHLPKVNLVCISNEWAPADNSYELSKIKCMKLSCPALTIPNGNSIPRGYTGMSVNFTCHDKYASAQFNGTAKVKCVNGNWINGIIDMQSVECNSVDCAAPWVRSSSSHIVKDCAEYCGSPEESKRQYEIVCETGYRLPESKLSRSHLQCLNDKWIVQSENKELSTSSVDCVPYCGTKCHNNGKCVAPDTCSCPNYWTGQFCEISTCNDRVPQVTNAEEKIGPEGPLIVCNIGKQIYEKTTIQLSCENGKWKSNLSGGVIPNTCTPLVPNNNTKCGTDKMKFPGIKNAVVDMDDQGVISAKCYSGFYFPNSYEREVPLICNDASGAWEMKDVRNLASGCVGSCEKSCENGGHCVGNDVCSCPRGFSGQRCESPLCSELPKNQNAAIHIRDLTAYASCRQGYRFPDGAKNLELKCKNGSWVYPQIFKSCERVYCKPRCRYSCLNGGWCYKPNTCKCNAGYTGDRCEIKTECLDFIPGVPFTTIVRVGKRNTATCKDGYASTGTATLVDVVCTAGMWATIGNQSISGQLKCVAVCNLPCKNNGVCIGPNTCKCPTEYGGPQCQHIIHFGCPSSPPHVPNSMLIYRTENGNLKCESGYRLPNYEKYLPMNCNRGRWIFGDYIQRPYSSFCIPICTIPCKNGGNCSAADTCTCLPNYTGPYCETFIEEPCKELPKPVPNAGMFLEPGRDSKSIGHYILCAPGFLFITGRKREELECVDGNWQYPSSFLSNESLTCQPVCKDPCLNGGVCTAPDTCMCPQPYTGNQCQHLQKHLCWHKPQNILNANIYFSPFSSVATCKLGYQLPNGNKQANFTCNNGVWENPQGGAILNLNCVPICAKACMNGGVCIAPDTCKCKIGFTGSLCEIYEGIKCDHLPNAVVNGTFYYEADTAILKCDPGYILTTGSVELLYTCRKDEWIDELEGKKFSNSITCLPICERPCQNGGICVSPNICECPNDFIGDVCQFERCTKRPRSVRNSITTYTIDFLGAVVRCIQHHRLPGGATGIKYKCKNGEWVTVDQYQIIGPNDACEPICERPCMNGGYCSAPQTCICAEGFFGSQCEKRYGTTLDGEKCLFPFRYKGRWFYGCIDDGYHRPWCATGTNIHGLITSWGVCVADLGTSLVVVTEDMEVCEFPFTYKGQVYNSCTDIDREKDWCATKTNGRNVVIKWGFCDCDWGSHTVLITSTGHECAAKQTHFGNEITGCVDDELKPWCGINIKQGEEHETVNDICLADWGSYHVSLTISGKVCKFPFKHRGADQWTCVSTNGTNLSWCATKTDENNVMLESDECPPYDEHRNLVKRQLTVLFPSLGFTNVHIKTVSGYTCALPFLYKNKQISGCTYMDSDDPWCAVEVDTVGNILKRDTCPPNWDIQGNPPKIETPCDDISRNSKVILTIKNEPCVMPFKYGGAEIYGCTSEGGGKPWCATQVDESLNPIAKGICPPDWDKNLAEYKSVFLPITQKPSGAFSLETEEGSLCIFPFVYKGKEHSSCIFEDSIRAWCPTGLDSHRAPIDWGYCVEGWEVFSMGSIDELLTPLSYETKEQGGQTSKQQTGRDNKITIGHHYHEDIIKMDPYKPLVMKDNQFKTNFASQNVEVNQIPQELPYTDEVYYYNLPNKKNDHNPEKVMSILKSKDHSESDDENFSIGDIDTDGDGNKFIEKMLSLLKRLKSSDGLSIDLDGNKFIEKMLSLLKRLKSSDGLSTDLDGNKFIEKMLSLVKLRRSLEGINVDADGNSLFEKMLSLVKRWKTSGGIDVDRNKINEKMQSLLNQRKQPEGITIDVDGNKFIEKMLSLIKQRAPSEEIIELKRPHGIKGFSKNNKENEYLKSSEYWSNQSDKQSTERQNAYNNVPKDYVGKRLQKVAQFLLKDIHELGNKNPPVDEVHMETVMHSFGDKSNQQIIPNAQIEINEQMPFEILDQNNNLDNQNKMYFKPIDLKPEDILNLDHFKKSYNYNYLTDEEIRALRNMHLHQVGKNRGRYHGIIEYDRDYYLPNLGNLNYLRNGRLRQNQKLMQDKKRQVKSNMYSNQAVLPQRGHKQELTNPEMSQRYSEEDQMKYLQSVDYPDYSYFKTMNTPLGRGQISGYGLEQDVRRYKRKTEETEDIKEVTEEDREEEKKPIETAEEPVALPTLN